MSEVTPMREWAFCTEYISRCSGSYTQRLGGKVVGVGGGRRGTDRVVSCGRWTGVLGKCGGYAAFLGRVGLFGRSSLSSFPLERGEEVSHGAAWLEIDIRTGHIGGELIELEGCEIGMRAG